MGSVTLRIRLTQVSGNTFCACWLSTTSLGGCSGMSMCAFLSQEESIRTIAAMVIMYFIFLRLEFELIANTRNDREERDLIEYGYFYICIIIIRRSPVDIKRVQPIVYIIYIDVPRPLESLPLFDEFDSDVHPVIRGHPETIASFVYFHLLPVAICIDRDRQRGGHSGAINPI